MPRAVATSGSFGYSAVSRRSTPARVHVHVDFAPRPSPNQTKPCSSRDVRTWKEIITLEFLKRPSFLRALSSPTSELHDILRDIFASRDDLRAPCSPDRYVNFAVDALHGVKEFGGTSLSKALAARLSIERAIRLEARAIREHFDILKQPAEKLCSFVCFHLYVKALPDAELYPPPGVFVAMTRRMARTWEPDLKAARASDTRKSPADTEVLDRSRIQLTIPEEVSCVVHDADTNEVVLVVVRNFCANGAILAGIALAGSRALSCRNNVRSEDPGSIVQAGFTAGSLSAPTFGLARNFASRAKGAAKAERASNDELAAALAYFWARAKSRFPSEVIEDVEGFYDAHSIPRFDPNWPFSATTTASLFLTIAGYPVSIPSAERAPGCAVIAEGYARPVHREGQPHRWAIGWNYRREGATLIGGHFYCSKYATEMRAAHDTAWSWSPLIFHTTGLSNAHPSTFNSEGFKLEGFAFVTPIRLASAYAAWARDTTTPREELVVRAHAALGAHFGSSGDGDISYS
ncbi:hypothetical protein FA13DRAFT_1820850 [Coprinellus micaceus]|uniref:Uncharacterized protein n=1 Tax=Coprinellus micaceus TaxID=71717 RepID=A0A4Y7SEV8_COPMI|nr:hypothetical protein FA13DRAFT_1820850 [Coprinellus micaceus]